ncbi:MAG: tetratricopeptide repeat protein [Ignavibacteriaceae bacterium]|nr:tetratricopeptide repeat protein [Ignavibacteriaceae bacterium]
MRKIFPKYLYILTTFFITSCGVWEDFTTYFNLYYNTKDKFVEAEKLIQQQRKKLFQVEEISVPGNVTQLLNSVIEKSSKILQFHSTSAYVDDALMMLGKSFFYQKNYQKALRKFQELVVTIPESDLKLENDLWIAKTQMRLKDYKNGLEAIHLVRSLAIEEGEDAIFQDAFVEEIVYYMIQENYPKSIEIINEFLTVSDNGEVNAEVMYELGKLYLKQNDLNQALASFEKVFDYQPSFEVGFNAKIELASALRETGEKERALSVLEDMRGENKYSDSFDKIDLEVGLTLYDLGRVEDAVNILTRTDTTYRSSINSGVARYILGEIFEYHYQNFDSASVFYTKASTSSITPEYLKLASEKSQLFKKYQALHKTLHDSKIQLGYLINPDLFIQDSIAYYDTLNLNQDIQSNERSSDNERRNFSESGLIQPLNTQRTSEKKNPPVRPKISLDSLQNIIAKSEYDLAGLFDDDFKLPDSAFFYYSNIVDSFANSRLYVNALYSLGVYHSSYGNREKADSIFNFIYNNYKTERVVNAAANQLKLPLLNFNFDPATELYSSAESKMLNKLYTESIKDFYSIFQSYPKSPLAPKALLAGGWILENELKLLDSAAVIYDTLNVRYPQSQYASTVKSKLNFYKQEADRKKKIIEDSLKQMEANKLAKQDSLKKVIDVDSDILEERNERNLELMDKKTKNDSSGVLKELLPIDSSAVMEPKNKDSVRKR